MQAANQERNAAGEAGDARTGRPIFAHGEGVEPVAGQIQHPAGDERISPANRRAVKNAGRRMHRPAPSLNSSAEDACPRLMSKGDVLFRQDAPPHSHQGCMPGETSYPMVPSKKEYADLQSGRTRSDPNLSGGTPPKNKKPVQ